MGGNEEREGEVERTEGAGEEGEAKREGVRRGDKEKTTAGEWEGGRERRGVLSKKRRTMERKLDRKKDRSGIQGRK